MRRTSIQLLSGAVFVDRSVLDVVVVRFDVVELAPAAVLPAAYNSLSDV